MGLPPQLITEELYAKAVHRLNSLKKDNRAAFRLRAIVSAKEQGVGNVAKVFGITTNTLRSWIKGFAKSSMEGLEYKTGRGRKGQFLEVHYKAIQEWTKEDPNLTIQKVIKKLEEAFNLKASKSVFHRALHRINLAYITPRPVHHKQDQSTHEAFKKKSSRSRTKSPN